MGPHCQFVESSLFTWQQPGFFVDFHGTLSDNNSTGWNPGPALDTLFGDNRSPVGVLSPSLCGDFIRITFINYRKFSVHSVSTPPFKSSSNLLVSPLISPSIPSSHSLHTWSSPSHSLFHPLNTFHLSLPGRSMCLPIVPSCISNPSESMDCSTLLFI